MQHLVAIAIGFVLDLVLGDPHAWPHPVRWIGSLVSAMENVLRRLLPESPAGLRAGGVFLVIVAIVVPMVVSAALLWLCSLVGGWLVLVVESVMCYQLLATRSLRDESMKVADALDRGSLSDARHAVSMIVARDTKDLDQAAIVRAAVETVAENVSDGVVAPLLFMALGGAPLGFAYKAANTMDSMVGYKNDRYRYFGAAPARLDDVLNYVPARLAGVLMCLAAPIVHLDGAGAWRIFLRDRRAHASPNAAHTEAACAGALGIQLAGSNHYFGKLVEKPTIGDAHRAVEVADIGRANRLMMATAVLGLVMALAIGFAVTSAWGGLPC